MSKTIELKGVKVGMTRIFEEQGQSIPVTVIEVGPAKVVRHKTLENDGYSAAVLATGEKKRSRMNKPEQGVVRAYGLESFASLYEVKSEELPEVDSTQSVEDFQLETLVKIRAVSKGKGFAGVVKRHNFAMQDRSHGNSLSHRAPGSIGINGAGRVFKGKKMAGHMGHEQVTLDRRQVVKIDPEHSLLVVKGPVPGPNGGEVLISQVI